MYPDKRGPYPGAIFPEHRTVWAVDRNEKRPATSLRRFSEVAALSRGDIFQMAKLSIRIDLSPTSAIGPGKIQLLELIDQTGSISAAARAMNMSYRRAWLLVDDLNHIFKAAVVVTHPGGGSHSGARLTASGLRLVASYREMEMKAHTAVAKHLRALNEAAKSKRLSSPKSR